MARLSKYLTVLAWVAALGVGASWLVPLSGCHDLLGIDPVVGDNGGGGPADAGTDAPSGDPCTGDIAAEDAWGCIVAAACEKVQECVGEAFAADDCLQTDFEFYDLPVQAGDLVMADAIAAGTVAYDSGGLAACVEALNAFQCSDFFTNIDPFDTCLGFEGTVEDGGLCFFDRECVGLGAECQQQQCDDLQCCSGVCRTPKKVGEECEQSFLCEFGSYCVEGTCQTGEVGVRCDSNSDCDVENWCNDGFCDADLPSGADGCLEEEQCPRPESCIGDDLAKSFSGTCGRSLVEGDPCDGQCASSVDHFCDQPSIFELGTCKTAATARRVVRPADSVVCARVDLHAGPHVRGARRCRRSVLRQRRVQIFLWRAFLHYRAFRQIRTRRSNRRMLEASTQWHAMQLRSPLRKCPVRAGSMRRVHGL